MKRSWPALLLLTAGVLVYAGALDGPFVFDDASILEDRDIRGFVPPWKVAHASPNSAAAGRPVVHYSLALNYAWGGLDVRGYRALNLALHLTCALLLSGVVRRTLELTGDPRLESASSGLATAVAALWMLHPLQTECVDYISQRSESLMGLFYLATLYAAIRALGPGRRRIWSAAAIVCCALGMASKESMVTAPLVVLLFDLVYAGRPPARLLRERGLLYAGLAAGWALLGLLMTAGPRSASVGLSLGTGALEYAMNQCIVILDYLRLALWPHPLVLDYGYPRVLSIGDVWPHALVLLALVGAAGTTLVRRPMTGFPAAWTFLLLAPTSSFVPIVTEVGAERRMYLALAGPVVLVVIGVYVRLVRADTARRTAWLGPALVIAVSTALAWGSVQRNRDYHSAVSIWRTAVDRRPDNHRAHSNLGKALQREGRLEEAMEHYGRSLELKPGHPEALNNLGGVLVALEREDEGIDRFREALAAEPGYVDARYNLAIVLQSRRRLDEAIVEYRAALSLDPDHARAHNNLGTALGSRGDLEQAIRHFREALRLEPGYDGARENLERALARSGRNDGR